MRLQGRQEQHYLGTVVSWGYVEAANNLKSYQLKAAKAYHSCYMLALDLLWFCSMYLPYPRQKRCTHLRHCYSYERGQKNCGSRTTQWCLILFQYDMWHFYSYFTGQNESLHQERWQWGLESLALSQKVVTSRDKNKIYHTS